MNSSQMVPNGMSNFFSRTKVIEGFMVMATNMAQNTVCVKEIGFLEYSQPCFSCLYWTNLRDLAQESEMSPYVLVTSFIKCQPKCHASQ